MDGKTAIITGATRGIGKAIAEAMSESCTNIAFTYNSNDEKAKSLASYLESKGCNVMFMKFDIGNYEACNKFIEDVIERFGYIHILVNNAGITKDTALALMKKEDWNAVIETNLTGVFNITKGTVYQMIKQMGGQIVNITSVSGMTGTMYQTNYAASKAGIIGFTKSLAKEVASYNIHVNAVAPGYIDTDMANAMPEKVIKKALKEIPLRRFGRVNEVANFVKFLVEGGASYITGHVFPIDGGLVI